MKKSGSNARVSFSRRPGAAAARVCVFCSVAGFAACLSPLVSADVGVSTTVLTVEQVYAAAKYKDPFIVSTVFGDEHAPKSKAGSGDVAVSTFSVYNLSLIGIMEDSRAKEALLSDKATGLAYVLKGGRLIDVKKKRVPGVVGAIKGKQVTLTTEDKQVYQLNLREKE
jgi:hypothetical protein